ncbi:MAG: hypothetical protein NT072_04785 [Deltaproteobacteria bacterium]|nr:hypothetical protein [Deltaproteobacteria bacterium]
MEHVKIAKQMVDFQKATYDNSFNAMIMLQEQTEKMISMAMEQASWLPAEGRKVITEWVVSYKKARDDYRKAVDDNFKRVEEFFATAGKS